MHINETCYKTGRVRTRDFTVCKWMSFSSSNSALLVSTKRNCMSTCGFRFPHFSANKDVESQVDLKFKHAPYKYTVEYSIHKYANIFVQDSLL